MTMEDMMRDLVASGLIPEPQDSNLPSEPDYYLYHPVTTAYGVPMAEPQKDQE